MTGLWDLKAVDGGYALEGHSGAAITLLVRGSERRVRKTARDADAGARLQAQMRKQDQAHRFGLPTPRVLAAAEHEGVFCYEMEFVQGHSLAGTFRDGHLPDLKGLELFISDLIETYRRTELGWIIPESLFIDKLASIRARCGEDLARAGSIERFDGLCAFVLEDSLQVPASESHGDLTFENILVGLDGRLTLIDFDDPGFSSWLLDLAKVFQDLWGEWCLRSLVLQDAASIQSSNARLRLEQARLAFEQALADRFCPGRRRLARLCVYHLLRILPYAKGPKERAYILGRATSVQVSHAEEPT